MGNMTLGEWLSEYSIDTSADYPVYVYDDNSCETIFTGFMCDIPDEIAEMDFLHWEWDLMTKRIGFVVE